jgi:hypothetical protein
MEISSSAAAAVDCNRSYLSPVCPDQLEGGKTEKNSSQKM